MAEDVEGLSRRRMLKTVGAGAAVAWTVPTVLTTSAAAAAGTPPPTTLPPEPPRGGIVVANHDEWPLSNNGFSNAPDAADFVANLAELFVGGPESGSFLAYSSNFGLTGSSLASAMANAGHSWTVSTAGPFTAAAFSAYDGVFLGGHVNGGYGYVNTAELLTYVANGGNVYVMGGTGNGGAAAEAAAWDPFLNALGLDFAPSYNGVSGNVAIASAHPLFDSVSALFNDNGNSVSAPGAPGRSAQVLVVHNGQGLYAISEPS